MPETIFSSHDRIARAFDAQLQEDGEVNLPPLQVPHLSVRDTGLAACLGTLGIALREIGPCTDVVHLDRKGDERGRSFSFWFDQGAPSHDPDKPHLTEALMGAWVERERFAREHPLHPLNHMRAALDAREYWLQVLHAWRAHRAILPIETAPGVEFYATDSLHAASVLKACGFTPLAFNGRAFLLTRARDGVLAPQILFTSTQEGQIPCQYMARVLVNYAYLKKAVESQSVIISQAFPESTTLLLTADSAPKTRDQFLNHPALR